MWRFYSRGGGIHFPNYTEINYAKNNRNILNILNIYIFGDKCSLFCATIIFQVYKYDQYWFSCICDLLWNSDNKAQNILKRGKYFYIILYYHLLIRLIIVLNLRVLWIRGEILCKVICIWYYFYKPGNIKHKNILMRWNVTEWWNYKYQEYILHLCNFTKSKKTSNSEIKEKKMMFFNYRKVR